MCAHYLPVPSATALREHFDVAPLKEMGRPDMWPGYMGLFIRTPAHADAGDDAVPPREAALGRWGLIPLWSKDGHERNTFNARSETAHSKPTFRDAWARGQRCIIPLMGVFEPDWRSGKAVPTLITRADGKPMALAGLWSSWRSPHGIVDSYTMLTVNADAHALMSQLHKPEDEKRMVVILPESSYADWLNCPVEQTTDFLHTYPADHLLATAMESAATSPNLKTSGLSGNPG